jgi:hypothetical protein
LSSSRVTRSTLVYVSAVCASASPTAAAAPIWISSARSAWRANASSRAAIASNPLPAVSVACRVVRCAERDVLAAALPVRRADPLVAVALRFVAAALRRAAFRFLVAAAFLPAAWRFVCV